MSSVEHNPEEVIPEPSERKILFSAIGWIGVISIFALIVFISYIYDKPEGIDQTVIEERLSRKAEHSAQMQDAASNYSKSPDGTIRIPVERSMELVLPDLQAKEVIQFAPNP